MTDPTPASTTAGPWHLWLVGVLALLFYARNPPGAMCCIKLPLE